MERRTYIRGAATGLIGLGVLPQIARGQTQEISAGETISGTITSSSDRDTYHLPVDQGDVVEVTFEKESLALTRLDGSGSGGSVYLAGPNSEGQEQFTERTTITESGIFEIEVDTLDDETTGQDYSFTATVNPTADKWPAPNPAEISPDETISGTIHTHDDRDTYHLPVDQGDVVEVTFEKESLALTRLDGSGSGGSVYIAGPNSEGQEQFTERTTITETGIFEIEVDTLDDVTTGQDYTFTATVNPTADKWPAPNPAEISPGETISGTIHTHDDRDTFKLPVDQGDVVEVTFEKESLALTRLDGSGSGGSVYLAGPNSEGQEQFTERTTITESGIFEIEVDTLDDETTGQDYSFTATVNPAADKWPAPNPAAISADETISGTIHSSDDRDTFKLPVDQGDVVEVTFEKESLALTRLDGSGSGGSVYLAGPNSEDQEQFTEQTSITETGIFEIEVDTLDDATTGQDYRFVVNGDLEVTKEPLTVSLSPTSITADTATDITLTITDETGTAVEGVSVELSGPGVAQALVTDSSGVATTTVNASDSGTIDVTATGDGYATASASITVEASSGGGGEVPPDAVYESGSTAAEYDSDNSGRINLSELGTAAADYAQGQLSISEIGNIAAVFANS